jgi:hypothetical protein
MVLFSDRKSQFWVNFGGPYIDCKNLAQTFGIFYDHLVHYVFIWYSFPVLVSCAMKNLATLTHNERKKVFFPIVLETLPNTQKNENVWTFRPLKATSGSGLPNGTFSIQKSQFG